MQKDNFIAATERINAGEPVPPIAPSLIKAAWEALSRLPKDVTQNRAIGLGAVAMAGPATADIEENPEQQVALWVRYSLLDALLEQGVLDGCMNDQPQREQVFTAAATFPCNKNDFGEAIAFRVLRDSPPDVAQKTLDELTRAGYDPAHLQVADKFKQWMQEHPQP